MPQLFQGQGQLLSAAWPNFPAHVQPKGVCLSLTFGKKTGRLKGLLRSINQTVIGTEMAHSYELYDPSNDSFARSRTQN